MIRVVIDTNVLIRYLIKPSTSIQLLIEDLWINDEILMVSSIELITELKSVLSRKTIQEFIHPEEGQALIEAVETKAEILTSLGEIPSYTRDLKDDKFIACAIAGGASFVISEDKDILSLGMIGDTKIITPYDFVRGLSKA